MGDKPGGVNVASKNMLRFPSPDVETVGNVSDMAVQVGTPSSDLGEEDGETKEPSVTEVLDVQYYKHESRDKDMCRKTSPVEILMRNFGIPKTSGTGGDGNGETPRELDKTSGTGGDGNVETPRELDKTSGTGGDGNVETPRELDKTSGTGGDGNVETPRELDKTSGTGGDGNVETPRELDKTSGTGGDGNVETPRELDKVDFSMLENLDHRRNRTTRCDPCLNEGKKSHSEFPDLLTSLEDPELLVSEDNPDARSTDERHQSKAHVYCTVYCIANDNYRKPSESTPPSEHASPSPSDVSVLPPTDSSNLDPDPELDGFPEPYTLNDLADPPMLNNVLYLGNIPLQCRVCLVVRSISSLHCCKKPVCEECMKTYITSQVVSGLAEIVCPIPECSGYLAESVVLAHLASENVAKYKYFLELGRLDSGTKTCPKCSLFTSLKGRGEPTQSKDEPKYKIRCSKCELVWCFRCHAPWHEGLKCREYRKGDKLLRNWASIIEQGQRNAQKCPRCKVHIQRVDGCDHMTCRQCNTNFCYRCGEKYRQLRFFGDHTSNLSVFGCKYRYLPEKPHLRRLVRGSVCAGKVLVAPVLIVLVVVIGALALVIGLVAFPIYYICKKNKHPNGMGRWLC